MSRRDKSVFEIIAEATALMPWWADVILAVLSYGILHYYANKGQPFSIILI